MPCIKAATLSQLENNLMFIHFPKINSLSHSTSFLKLQTAFLKALSFYHNPLKA